MLDVLKQATEPALRRLSADLSLAEETLGEVQEQMMALLANYHCLGSDVEFLEAQLWNQVPCPLYGL